MKKAQILSDTAPGIIYTSGFSEYFKACSYDVLLDLIKLKRNICEYINENALVNFFLDIDLKSDHPNFLNHWEYVTDIMRRVQEYFADLGYECFFYVMEAHSENKKSYHIILRMRNEDGQWVCFKNVGVLKSYVVQIFKDKEVDLSVYRDGLFRTIYSSKIGEHRPFIKCEQLSSPDLTDIHSFVCYTEHPLHIVSENAKNTIEQAVDNATNRHENSANNRDNDDNDNQNEDDKHVITEYIKRHFNPNVRELKLVEDCIVIGLDDKNCPFIGREHNSNHQYIVIDKHFIKQKCHDSECAGKVSRETALSNICEEFRTAVYRILKTDKEKVEEDYARYIGDTYKDTVTDLVMTNTRIQSQINSTRYRNIMCDCDPRHQKYSMTQHGLNMTCEQCGHSFPENGLITIPTEYRNIFKYFNININNVNNLYVTIRNDNDTNTNAEEGDKVTIHDLHEVFFDDLELNKRYIEYIKYKTVHNLSQILKYIIGETRNYIYSSAFIWYEWSNEVGKWVKRDNVIMDREFARIDNDIVKIEKEVSKKNYNRTMRSRIHRLVEDVGNPVIRESAIKMWKTRNMDTTIERQMNSNVDLIGFKDGVFDFNSMEFRNGQRDDYITMSANVYYKHPVDGEKYNFVEQFFKDILPNDEIRTYFLKVLSICLTGKILQNVFILSGYGKNGKSVLCGLLQETLGEYCEQPRPAILTRRAENANEANSAVMKLKSKRIVIVPEPNAKEQLQVDKIKAWTGGETINCRELNQSETTFEPQFKLMIMCNKKPSLSDNDGGIRRRLKIINFPNLFVQNPTKENERQIDLDILEKLTKCKREFVELLINHYKLYKNEGLREPEDVRELAEEYLQDNNDQNVVEFMRHLVLEENKVLTKNDMKRKFRELFGKSFTHEISQSIEKEIMEKFGIEYRKSTLFGSFYRGWLGLRFKNLEEITDEENDS